MGYIKKQYAIWKKTREIFPFFSVFFVCARIGNKTGSGGTYGSLPSLRRTDCHTGVRTGSQ